MRVGVPRETKDREFRVAMTPDGVRAFTAAGHEVWIERGAGLGSGFDDDTFAEAGGKLVGTEEAWGEPDLVVKVKEPIAEEYHRRKQERNAQDFNDLLIRARELLTGPGRGALRKRLSSQIGLLLVDEFQDTDPVQAELVEALCQDELTRGKLFFVGDYKQSIYRFRGADPHVFRQLRNEIPPKGRLPLTLNFRSQPAILHFVNALFCDAMGSDYEPLVAHRPQVAPEPAIELLWAPDESPQERSGRSTRLRRREAEVSIKK